MQISIIILCSILWNKIYSFWAYEQLFNKTYWGREKCLSTSSLSFPWQERICQYCHSATFIIYISEKRQRDIRLISLYRIIFVLRTRRFLAVTT